MPLQDQILAARREIKPDGYDMSLGEIMNLYRDKELVINPAYQRLFRWKPLQKTRFIESLLLGIPVPPIFVFQSESGVWELIDGLQRVSTVLEFTGLIEPTGPGTADESVSDDEPNLPLDDGDFSNPVTLLGTRFLPDLENKAWEPSADGQIEGIGGTAQLFIRRARLRVEILRQEGSADVKYELFQRLNTGGTSLSEQEVRNCTAIMIDGSFHVWLVGLASDSNFVETTQQTETALRRQAGTELALRFLAFRHISYEAGLNVHEYLDKALVALASDKTLDRDAEQRIFQRTFALIRRALGTSAFKRWNGTAFTGKFMMSVFEVVSRGVAENLDTIEALGSEQAQAFLNERVRALWENPKFTKNSGAGVRGTTRLANLLAMGPVLFHP
jgi:hypothetical protein